MLSEIQKTFDMYDRDHSNTLSTVELRSALHAVGYRLNYHVLNALVIRYGNRQGTLAFDDFLMCAIKMKTMIGRFTETFRFFF
jgi:calpain